MAEYEIPFSFYHDQQHFRLIELPPSLLDLITSDDPPPLQLKSASSSQSSKSQAASNAVVCTPDETFDVRQVQSSNVLYILQPSKCSTEERLNVAQFKGVTAIAQCKGLLELVKASPNPEQYLRANVPAFNHEIGSVPSRVHRPTRLELLRDAPFSSGEFHSAWKQLCIFEVEGRPWLPTALVLRNIWASLLSAAIINDIDTTGQFKTTAIKILLQADGHAIPALEAIFARNMSDTENIMTGCMLFDREKCITWLGSVLANISGPAVVQPTDFVEKWRDMVPEAWREHVELTKLRVNYSEASDGKIMFIQQPSVADGSTAPSAGSIPPKNKWHEKFRNSSNGNKK